MLAQTEMTTMFKTGQTVTVNDPHSFYRGRTATVLSVNTWGDRGTFLYVRVESATGNAWIGFNIRAEHAVAS